MIYQTGETYIGNFRLGKPHSYG
jgi:hypothetical protein